MTGTPFLSQSRFVGVWRIVQFNWPRYSLGGSVAFLLVVLVCVLAMPTWLELTVILGAATATWWLFASLAASWWIYDRSPLMRFAWIREVAPKSSINRRRTLNVHSGYDDSTAKLARLFSDDELTVLDLFDATRMTEPSIHRARRVSPLYPNTMKGQWNAWPVADGSVDLVLLLLAAHEFRLASERQSLFVEAQRVLAPRGRVVVAEHLRNSWNFAAFGWGFLHFWPRAEWLRLATAAGFRLVLEDHITPFVRYFVREK